MRQLISIECGFKKNLKKDNITITLTPVVAFMTSKYEIGIAFMFGPAEISINYLKNK